MSFVITGSVAYDYLMRYPGRFRDQILPDKLESLSLSFLADSMTRARGGVAANIAYTMKLLRADPVILATVGNDFGDYRRWLEENGLTTAQIIEIPDELTATFFVSTDSEQNQIANFYTGAMAHARHYSLADRQLDAAQVVLISPNDPTAMLNYAKECKQLGIAFAYDPSQQLARLDGADLIQSIPGAAFLLGNEYELAMIQNKTGWSLEQIREQVSVLVMTLGKRGSVIYSGDTTYEIPIAEIAQMADPTGAGDAFRAGFFAGYLAGMTLDVCGRMGALCSAYTLENMGTTAHRFTIAEFTERYEQYFGVEPKLAGLASPGVAR